MKIAIIALLAALALRADAQIVSTQRTRAWRAALQSTTGGQGVIHATCRHSRVLCAGRWRCRGKACPDARGRWLMVVARIGPFGAYPDPIVFRGRHSYCTAFGANADGPPFTLAYACFGVHADGTPVLVQDEAGAIVPRASGTMTLVPR